MYSTPTLNKHFSELYQFRDHFTIVEKFYGEIVGDTIFFKFDDQLWCFRLIFADSFTRLQLAKILSKVVITVVKWIWIPAYSEYKKFLRYNFRNNATNKLFIRIYQMHTFIVLFHLCNTLITWKSYKIKQVKSVRYCANALMK